jgi:electron transfer flavoprotein alpha subunit
LSEAGQKVADRGGVWVFCEHEAGDLTRISREVLSEGRRLADVQRRNLVAVVAGHDIRAISARAGRFGADTILLIDHPLLDWYSVLPYCTALAGAVRHYEPHVVLFGATPLGNDLAPRLAARLGLGLVCDCNLVEGDADGGLLASKPTYGGKASTSYRFIADRPYLLTLAAGATEIKEDARAPQVIVWEPPDIEESMVRRLGTLPADPETVSLSEAQVIVAGGRGVGSHQAFTMVEELGRILRGSVGGTRVAFDQGWIPLERQIGQTGKTVAPRFLMSLGTSGATQYTQGLKDAEYVLAVDRNPHSAVFDVADVGVVADLRVLLPLLIDKLKSGYTAVADTGSPQDA